ncbi:DEAD/DEAH box helicase domain-containing protein [Paenibacillus cellulosilyticus]|uniref:DEAD/DEAH box helicase domain-containing protein n=1 Tax=Paenibacillus cellulosilyticus TaxID=375489 RepID=A0A2V2YRP6_9BACL|nr:DEAD/DEAH box helicase [Paenibacillus cellulosilyticus]PWW00684.1 DEAD/DEAH box helicase domain-containing protein [Paenibacillus cellulosilyticus]QKS45545.1 DEAD/DEAH box helicase [Paenibacillus cellulosilyticus]
MNQWTGRARDLEEWLEELKKEPELMDNVTHWHTIPPRDARTSPLPNDLAPELKEALRSRGIEDLYVHQAKSYGAVRAGDHVVAVTPTASGKTMCYNLPVLQSLLENSDGRALYMFPTKALAQDQVAELQKLADIMEVDIKTHTYDGDTPPTVRTAIRNAGHIVVTNPDMLHSAILPHHTKWVKLFENIRYIVIDELHAYRGVFGSHVANVIRRLKRICRFYGSSPQFICASATIDNPKEHAERLIGESVTLVNDNGAPMGEKHFIFYNPPVVNQQLGIRRSSVLETRKLAGMLLRQGVQTIVFARSRVRVELLLTYLQELVRDKIGDKTIRGYRGGYLPKLRREIEKGLRSGEIRGVVSTNALELGIDIGQLQACVLNGYPGTVASTWQQSGRAGRRKTSSVTFMVASSNPLDQYIIQNPDYFFNRPPERALIHPDNLLILIDHVKCAAYELPFELGETFGSENLEDMLEFLVDEKVLHRTGSRWYWMEQSFPAHGISLRSAAQENFIIIDMTEGSRVLGEVDRFSAPTLIHDEAIYIHEGVQYQVEKLDYHEKKAYVREVDVDYYTDANMAVELKVLHADKEKTSGEIVRTYGEVTVNAKATIFKKIRLRTHENIGSGPIHLPEEELHTSGYWFSFSEEAAKGKGTNEMQCALLGLANVLVHIAPVYLMCDPLDIRVVPQVKAIHTQRPTIYFYDRYPGGIGLSERLYEVHDELLGRAHRLISNCTCLSGCPACVGPIEEVGLLGKAQALQLLEEAGAGR